MVRSSPKRVPRTVASSRSAASPATEDSIESFETDATEVAHRRASSARVSLFVSASLIAIVHYWLADPQAGPRILADEIGYLANARYLAGGGVIDMSHTAFYAGGYSLAIAPLSRLFAHNPGHLYESIIVLQAVFAGLSVILIARLCRWLFAASWSVSILAACVAGLYPSFVTATGFAWSESMLTFALLVAVSAAAWVVRSFDERPVRSRSMVVRAAIAGCACGYVLTVHNRTMLAMLAVVVILGVALARRHAPGPAIAVAAGFVATAIGGQFLNSRLKQALWRGAGGVDTSGRISSLLRPHGVWAAFRGAVGQYWYQFVATGGLIAIALTALALLALRTSQRTPGQPDGERRSSSRSTVAAIIFVVFVALFAVSVVFLANGKRGDAIVYGRYLDIATPLLIAVAVTWLGTSPSPRSLRIASAAVVASSAGWLVLHFGARVELARRYNRVTTFSILGWLDTHRGGPMLLVPTLCAVAIALGALAISFAVRHQAARRRIGTAAIASGVACLFIWQLTFTHSRILTALASGATHTRATVRVIDKTGTSELGLDQSITVVDKLAFAFWLPDVTFRDMAPSTASCSRSVSISRATHPSPGQTQIASSGAFHLYRGQRSCVP